MFKFPVAGGYVIRAINDQNHATWFLAKDICTAVGLKPTQKEGYSKHLTGLSHNEVSTSAALQAKANGYLWVSADAAVKLTFRGNKWLQSRLLKEMVSTIMPTLEKDKVSKLEQQAKGLEKNEVESVTVNQFCNSLQTPVSHLQRIKLGRMARTLSTIAGRDRHTGSVTCEYKYNGKTIKQKREAALHTVKSLERAAEAIGIKL